MSGYQLPGGLGIGIMEMPGRKSKALYATRDNIVYPLAYFRSDAYADEAEKLLAVLVRGTLTEGQRHDR